MIRLREFNMAELEYFIDPEVDLEHDFSQWSSIQMNLLSESDGEIKMSIGDAVAKGIIRHPTVGLFMAKTFDFLNNLGFDSSKLRFRQHESDEMAHYASD